MGGHIFVGRVVSNRMQKSVVVAVSYVVWVPKYGVYEKRVSRHMAHDEQQQCVVGDVVKIVNTGRKLSKHKSYNVDRVLLATPSYDPVQAAKDVEERLAARPPTVVDAAKKRLEASQARLRALREAYAKELAQRGVVETREDREEEGGEQGGSTSSSDGEDMLGAMVGSRGEEGGSDQVGGSSSTTNSSSSSSSSSSISLSGSSSGQERGAGIGTSSSGVRTFASSSSSQPPFDTRGASTSASPSSPVRSRQGGSSSGTQLSASAAVGDGPSAISHAHCYAAQWQPVTVFMSAFLGSSRTARCQ